MKTILRWWRQFRCAHEFDFFRNIYGDEIIYSGYKRSVWKCRHCWKFDYRDYLGRDEHGRER